MWNEFEGGQDKYYIVTNRFLYNKYWWGTELLRRRRCMIHVFIHHRSTWNGCRIWFWPEKQKGFCCVSVQWQSVSVLYSIQDLLCWNSLSDIVDSFPPASPPKMSTSSVVNEITSNAIGLRPSLHSRWYSWIENSIQPIVNGVTIQLKQNLVMRGYLESWIPISVWLFCSKSQTQIDREIELWSPRIDSILPIQQIWHFFCCS